MPPPADKIKSVFLEALEKASPADRVAFLVEACAEDSALRARVEDLLRVHDRLDPLLDRPAAEAVGEGLEDDLDFLAPPRRPGALGRLGEYEVLEVAGRGGMGVVFRAFDDKLQRVVAIKALAPHLATSAAARQRFVREARAAAAVTHDNVIAIHAVEDTGPHPFLVMQFIDGASLQDKLDRAGPLPLKEILRIGLHVAEGLAAAHRLGLVHRDIKPANILLENGVERVKITDFGLARAADDASLTQSGVVAGTPQYMSPEQAEGQAVDHRSDLFSLGSVLYAMCTGHPPFRAPTTVAVLKRVCEETPRPLREVAPELPPWLDGLIFRLHAKAPAARFASAREVADLLAQCLAEVQRGVPLAPPAAPVRPRRHWRLGAAAVLVVVLAGMGLFAVSDIRGTLLRYFSGADTPAGKAPVPNGSNSRGPSPTQRTDTEAAAWERSVAEMPPAEQIKAVVARLKDLNPGFDGNVTPTINGDRVTGLRFSSDKVRNLAPVRALTSLTFLDVSGNQGRLADLSPLTGLPLSILKCSRTRVSDLSPLKGMPLTVLECSQTDVSDLTALRSTPLSRLYCAGCLRLSDLTPLKGMRLTFLDVSGSDVSDLAPLRGQPLQELSLYDSTRVTDLSPLHGMPLETLNLGKLQVTTLSPLEGMTTLRSLVLDGTPVSDLADLKALSLNSLMIRNTRVSDLAPLKGMPLKRVWLDRPSEQAAETLRSLKDLEQINDKPVAEFWKEQGKAMNP